MNFLQWPEQTTEETQVKRPAKSTKQLLALYFSMLLLLAAGSALAGQNEAAAEATAQPAKKLSVSNKWRLECSGNAESDGAVVLKISQQDADPITIEIPVTKGTSENGVAKTIVKVLKANLDKKAFHVERDDGEDVLVKKKGKTKNFGLEIVSNSVKHLRLNLEKE